MKKYILILTVIFYSCFSDSPTQFSKAALSQVLVSQTKQQLTLKKVLDKHKGKHIVIDFWASWCGDCIKNIPAVKELQKKNTEVVFLYLSVDKSFNAWQMALQKHALIGEHYNLPKGMKEGALVNFINLRFIPRYMVVDTAQHISVFKSTNAASSVIKNALQPQHKTL